MISLNIPGLLISILNIKPFHKVGNFDWFSDPVYMAVVVQCSQSSKVVASVMLMCQDVFQMAAWILSYLLMILSYRKGLSEEWYSQKMFWTLSLALNASIFLINWRDHSIAIIIVVGVQIGVNTVLFVAMLMT
jgi:hypothetical protein